MNSLIERVGRRTFLKVLGTAAPVVAASACSPVPPERIIPYVIPPEDVIPGVAAWYASACGECPAGCGVHVRTREGRAVKIEGNPDHPVNQGRLCIRGQAALQGLYNPDRIRGARRREVMNEAADQSRLSPVGWEDALAELTERIQAVRESGATGRIGVLTPLLTGSLDALFDAWAEVIGARRLRYEPFGHEAIRTASRLCFDRDAVPHYDLARAEVLVSFGADFLETWLSTVEHTGAFTDAHRLRDGRKSRFVHVEPRLSLTASNADEWIAAAPGAEVFVALAMTQVILAEERAQGVSDAEAATIGALVAPFAPDQVADRTGVSAAALTELARAFSDPTAGPGRSLAIGGGPAVSGSNATDLQVALHLLNRVAGNTGATVRFGPDAAWGRVSSYGEVADLVESMRAGDIDVLVTYDVDPAFALPGALDVDDALARVPFFASFSNVLDDTTARADLVLPVHGPLESWGDAEPRAGIRNLLQPTMQGLFDSRHVGDMLLDVGRRLGGEVAAALPAADFYEYLQTAWRARYDEGPGLTAPESPVPGAGFEDFWAEALQRGGVWSAVDSVPVTLSPNVSAFSFEGAAFSGPDEGLILMPYASLHFYDGRGANRPWLQEIPDPVTKAAWSSWAEIHPDTARTLDVVTDGQLLSVESDRGQIDVPVLITAQVRPGVIAIPIGQGHRELGRYAAGRGVNPVRLIDPEPAITSRGPRWLSSRVRVTARDLVRPVPRTQTTDSQFDRDVAMAVSLPELNAGRIEPEDTPRSLYPEHEHPGARWGMAIDLDTCTGCNACVAACYAENNVPTVGAEGIQRGRTMAWLRIERFTSPGLGTLGITPDVRHMPMLCQHCDHAPCETVCPVYATYHTEEGLNAQVYNRCVGTRYCSNNCPYKVRRFNWFEPEFPDPQHFQLNPDVTVRSVGVMEKCTFCVQRIQEGKDRAKDDDRSVQDGDIVPACAQTCPGQAIVFGDLSDPDSRVSQLAAEDRGYGVFSELNTRPAITYLKKVVP